MKAVCYRDEWLARTEMVCDNYGLTIDYWVGSSHPLSRSHIWSGWRSVHLDWILIASCVLKGP